MKKPWAIVVIVLFFIIAGGAAFYFFIYKPKQYINKYNALTAAQQTAFITWVNKKYNVNFPTSPQTAFSSSMKNALMKYLDEFIANGTQIADDLQQFMLPF